MHKIGSSYRSVTDYKVHGQYEKKLARHYMVFYLKGLISETLKIMLLPRLKDAETMIWTDWVVCTIP